MMYEFPFELDDFQKEACKYIDDGKSVVVCAPTGAGKTVIAQHAIHRALEDDVRIFYTTPLKALSNQKFSDFSEQYGSEKVGLLTGDTSHNRDAQIVVMTTEVFRNMLYGTNFCSVSDNMKDVIWNTGRFASYKNHVINILPQGFTDATHTTKPGYIVITVS